MTENYDQREAIHAVNSMPEPKPFTGEQQAILAALSAGRRYGYGNVIAHLRAAWAKSLIESTKHVEGQETWTEEQAQKATNSSPYSIAQHEAFLR